jgi:NAD(P)-dependent dehydrogenase (short-subunit alcohol dehydrogenase family)
MGLATAKLLASRGAIVSLADINAAALQTATESLTGSDKHMSTVIDVRSSRSVDDWIASTVERLGRLDGAVNMAGIITPAKPVAEELLRHGERRGVLSCTGHNQNPFRLWPVHAKSLVDGRDVGLQFAVNTRGVFFCMRAEIKAMKAGGSIVSSSTCSKTTEAGVVRTLRLTCAGFCGQYLWSDGFTRGCPLLRQ